VIAHFGDLLGRKRMFTLSIFLMAAPTLVIGLLPTYASIGVAAPLLLLAMRVLQGAAIGGEMPGAWVFVAENVPARRYGFGIDTLTAGITGGILLGSLIAVAINAHYTPAEVSGFAWRIPFILGGVFGLVSVYLRRFLHETPVFQELADRRSVARELPLKTILREHRGASLPGTPASLAPVRFSGLSFAYNMAYAVFGGLTPVILTLWLQKDAMAPARYVAVLAALGFVLALLPLAARGHAMRAAPGGSTMAR
jgi:MFS family permease